MLLRLLFSLVILVLITSCKEREISTGILPVHQVEYEKHWITLRPEDGVAAQQLINLRFFHGISPGTTRGELIKRLGSPSNKIWRSQSQYDEYFFSYGRLEILGEVVAVVSLTAYPNNITYRSVLIPAAVESLRLRSVNSVIQIVDRDEQLIVIALSGERVESIWWRGPINRK